MRDQHDQKVNACTEVRKREKKQGRKNSVVVTKSHKAIQTYTYK